MEKKLLTIFGASGLVGSSILREALDRGYHVNGTLRDCLLYTSPSPRDYAASRMPSSA